MRKEIKAKEKVVLWIRDGGDTRLKVGMDNITRAVPDVLMYAPSPETPDYRFSPGTFYEINIDIQADVRGDKAPFIEIFELIVIGRVVQRQQVFASDGCKSLIGLGSAQSKASEVEFNTVDISGRDFSGAIGFSR